MMARQALLMERVLDETRLAVIEDGRLAELYIERPDGENLTGNIYLGRVQNVLPGMNAAFVDIGMEKNGFLAAGDLGVEIQDDGSIGAALRASRIETMVRPGQDVLVQVVKSQPGGKGPRLTSHIALAGRRMVLLTDVPCVGVSRKLDEDERARLRAVGLSLLEAHGVGMILRTAARGAEATVIGDEYARLLALWDDLRSRAAHAVAPKRMHDDNALSLRAVRDLLGDDVDALWADGEALCGELKGLAEALAPQYANRIMPHGGETPLFDLHRVDAQAERALQKYVWLKGGGSLVIEETEALTVVDVNTARNVGKQSAEETIFRNNCEAAEELMRQLRLRDIGGIIVADFIDMKSLAHRDALLELLRERAARDRVRVNVVGITPLGLVEMTRKKARQSLSRQLLHTCTDCGGNGTVPSYETTARRIIRDIWRRSRMGEVHPMLVEVSAPVCGRLQTLGAPENTDIYVCPTEGLAAGEYRVSPAEVSRLPRGSKHLK